MNLPSLFQLSDGFTDSPLIAVATRIIGPSCPGDIESWDLALHGDAFEPLTLDPFSFVGQFSDQGLMKLRMELLGPAGFVFPLRWACNSAGSEYHATIRWMTWTTKNMDDYSLNVAGAIHSDDHAATSFPLPPPGSSLSNTFLDSRCGPGSRQWSIATQGPQFNHDWFMLLAIYIMRLAECQRGDTRPERR